MVLKKVVFFFIKILSFLVYPFYILFRKIGKPLISLLNAELITLRLKSKGVQIGNNFRVGKNPTIRVGKNTNIKIGNNVVLGDDVYINVKRNSELFIGNNVHINKGVRISSFESISIGNDVLIASYCNLLDHNHQFDLKSPASTKYYDCAPIKLENGSWLGTKVQVNKGTIVGEFSIVASNSVVTKNISKSCIYGGIPAKKIKCLEK